MKKYFLSICILLFAFSVIAQPKLEVGLKSEPDKVFPLEDGNYFFLNQSYIHIVNENLTKGSVYKMEPNYLYHFLDAYDNETDIFSFFTYLDKKADTYGLYMDKYSKTGSKYKFSPQKITTIPLENKDKTKSFITSSLDGSKIAFSMILTDKKDIFKGIYTVVLNNSGEVLWQSARYMQFENSTFYLHNMAVSNTGEVYFASVSRNINTRGTSANSETCIIININENGHEMYSKVVDFGYVKDMKLKLLRNGKIFLAGYYSKEIKEHAIGLFTMTYDDDFSNMTTRPLGKFVDNTQGFNPITGGVSNAACNLMCEEIYELENGNIVLLGELQHVVYYPGSGYNYLYHYKGVLYHRFSETGEELYNHFIDKYQQYATNMPIPDHSLYRMGSFNSFQVNNDIYLVFNDNSSNYPKMPETPKPLLAGSIIKACTILTKISIDNTVERKMVQKRSDTKETYHHLVYSDDKCAILRFTDNTRKLTF